MKNKHAYSFLNSRLTKIKKKKDYEVVVTGLSYALHGIVEDQMKKKCMKLALLSQDLYYDYIIMKNIIKPDCGIKYCIIGLAYYSFDFDIKFSRSESAKILDIYYPIFKDSHQLKLPLDYSYSNNMRSFRNICNSILEDVFKINTTPDYNENSWNIKSAFIKGPIESLDEEARIAYAKERVASHNRQNHPETRREYEEILNQYLALLVKHNIKPIVVVFPTTKYYYNNFDVSIIERFYSIINTFKTKYDFQLIDMFTSELFDVNDFLDWDHLNKKGAAKMTAYLNNLIKW